MGTLGNWFRLGRARMTVLAEPRITPTGKRIKAGSHNGDQIWSEPIRVELPTGFCALIPLTPGHHDPEYDEILIDRAEQLEAQALASATS